MKRIAGFAIRRVPPPVVRYVGRVQLRHPLVFRAVNAVLRVCLPTVGRVRHGVAAGMWIDATDAFPGYILGTTDIVEQHFIRDHLKSGFVVYDVGANIGFHTLMMARLVGAAGRVFAFEPFPTTALQLRRNVDGNHLNYVVVIEAAASDRNGRCVLDTNPASAVQFSINRPNPSGIDVPAVRLDDELKSGRLTPPDLIKIDVEGAELMVLSGASEVIRTHRPLILCEVHWLGRAFLDYVDAHLRPLGYTIRMLDGGPIPEGPERYHLVMDPGTRP